MSLVIVGLWTATNFFASDAMGIVGIPVAAAIIAGLTAVTSLVAYWLTPKHSHVAPLLAAYVGLMTTTLLIIGNSGHLSSPFIALWMIVGIFSGLFGIYGISAALLATIGYGAFLFASNLISSSRYLMFALAFGLPIIVSYLIWHKKSGRENEKDKVVDRLAHELSQEASKSDIVINAIADGVIAVDKAGIIQLINPAAQNIIGWGQDDAIGLDYGSVLKLQNDKAELLKDDSDPVQRCLKTGETISSEDLALETSSGKKLLVSLHVSPLDSAGSGSIIVFRDITQQKADEREQAEFVSTASHEMRTPVAAIEGYLGLALNPQTANVDAKARTYLEKAHESAQHLGRLFQDLLDVSKAEDGRLKNQPTIIDTVSLARDITNSFATAASDKGLGIVFKPDAQALHNGRITPQLFAMADIDHFREVVSNLIENALKYTQAGEITVDVTGDDEHVTVGITDTGIGIPAEDIPHLFQKFYRVDNSNTREIGGTGLGLYLSRRLAEAMGGRLWVKSDYGNGSTFSIELPRVSAEKAAAFQQASQEAPAEPAAFPLTPGGATAQAAAAPATTVETPVAQTPVTPSST